MQKYNTDQQTVPSHLGELSDDELVCRLIAGDQCAMEILFDRYYRMVMSVALRIVRDTGEAQDVVQVVFTDFYRSAKLFDADKGSFKSWLLQYAYGRSINRKQSLKSQKFYDKNESANLEVTESNGSRLFNLEPSELKLLAQEILATLEDKQRIVIEMICFRGLTLAETAAATGESLGNVQHMYYRGLEKLRLSMSGQSRPKTRAEDRPLLFGMFRRREKRQHELEMEVVKARTL